MALCVLVALLLLTNRRFSSLHDADSILLAYNSLQKLTLFMWEQNRLGNLVPLLAKAVPTIYANELTQIFVRALFGVSSLVALLWLAGARRHLAPLFSALLIWLIAVQWWRANSIYLQETPPYAQGIALFGLACALLDRAGGPPWRRALAWSSGLAVMAGVFWVNLAAVLTVAPYLGVGLALHRSAAWLRRAGAAAAGFAVGLWLMTLGPAQSYGAANLGLAPLRRSLERFADCYNAVPLALLTPLLVLGAAATILRPSLRAAPQPSPGLGLDRPAFLGLAVSALLYVPVVGQLGWVSSMDFDHRYFVAPVAILAVLATLALAEAAVRFAPPSALDARARRWAAPLLTAAALTLWIAAYGMPSTELPANTYAREARARLPVLAGARAFLVAGDYQQGWTSLFELQRDYEARRGPASTLFFGLSHRPANTLDQSSARLADLYAADGRVVVACLADALANCREQIERISMLPFAPAPLPCPERCEVLEASRPAAASAAVSFRSKEAKPWLAAGWLEPAPNGALSKMTVTRLVFSVGAGDRALDLSLSNILAGLKIPLPLSIRLGGVPVAEVALSPTDAPFQLRIELPAAAALAGVADLEFRAGATASPKRLGWSEDDGTPLAFSLLSVAAVPGAAPGHAARP